MSTEGTFKRSVQALGTFSEFARVEGGLEEEDYNAWIAGCGSLHELDFESGSFRDVMVNFSILAEDPSIYDHLMVTVSYLLGSEKGFNEMLGWLEFVIYTYERQGEPGIYSDQFFGHHIRLVLYYVWISLEADDPNEVQPMLLRITPTTRLKDPS